MTKRKSKKTILIIDDDKSILSSLSLLLNSEGFKVVAIDNGSEAVQTIKKVKPSLVILDIWLPDIDGLEVLSNIKKEFSDIDVVMISGHAGIQTAIRATKLGAADFIEKPFTSSVVLNVIEKSLSNIKVDKIIKKNTLNKDKPTSNAHSLIEKREIYQKTIKDSVVINGLGLLTGKKLGMQLSPAPPNTGIKFIDINTNKELSLDSKYLIKIENGHTVNSTALCRGGISVRTIEHLLSVFHIHKITNLLVKFDEEIPNIDGSALSFSNLIKDAKLKIQEEKTYEIVVKDKLVFGEIHKDKSYMIIEPSDTLSIDLRIDFASPIGEQQYVFNCNRYEDFEKEIAPARTFNTIDNIHLAQKSGAVGSGLIKSHIIVSDDKIVNTNLRFEDEFVRHKILDIIGDMYILAQPMVAKITANKSSHALNHIAIKKIKKLLKA